MSAWVLWPRDPLVVRDGRPNQGRSESATLAFPWPGTAAGVVRTRVGSDADGRFVATDPAKLQEIGVRGPILTDGGRVFAPAPRDALALRDQSDRLFALRPLDDAGGARFDDGSLAPVGFRRGELPEGKAEALPAWWAWEAFARWLASPDALTRKELAAASVRALPRERRVHVKLTAERVAEDAMLFETDGLRFTRASDDHPLDAANELGLFVDVAEGAKLRAGLGAFAGERRLVRWEESAVALPAMPDGVRGHLARDAGSVRVRVLLLTPGCFAAGSQPSFAAGSALGSRDGVTVRPVASIVPRPETVSGWDFARKRPKGTRRLVSAGSVFWVELTGSPERRLAWAEGVWMRNVSEAEQDRRDGYGLAALGVG